MQNPLVPIWSIMAVGGAKALAEHAHAGQFDKGGRPYIEHVCRVAEAQSGIEAIIVAWLHDVVEDGCVTLGDLRATFKDTISDAVAAMTRRDGESYGEYINRVAANPLARVVKIADLHDNMDLRRIPEPSAEDLRRVKKYARALAKLQAADDDKGAGE